MNIQGRSEWEMRLILTPKALALQTLGLTQPIPIDHKSSSIIDYVPFNSSNTCVHIVRWAARDHNTHPHIPFNHSHNMMHSHVHGSNQQWYRFHKHYITYAKRMDHSFENIKHPIIHLSVWCFVNHITSWVHKIIISSHIQSHHIQSNRSPQCDAFWGAWDHRSDVLEWRDWVHRRNPQE